MFEPKNMLKRAMDIILSGAFLVLLSGPMFLIAILVRITSPGPAVHWSKRIGKNNQLFLMPKYRTMRVGAPQVATHLLQDSGTYITKIGAILRKTSLDELPQLWSVLVGDMSLVGPRPALFNQDDLVALRNQYGIDGLRPGVTGWAQINGRDELPVPLKVRFDKEYLDNCGIVFDLKILLMTLVKVLRKEGVRH